MPRPLLYFSDGSCKATDRTGGWSAVRCLDLKAPQFALYQKVGLADVLEIKHRAGGQADTTISRMELSGMLAALIDAWQYNEVRRQSRDMAPRPVEVYTDSQYVQKGMTIYMANWLRKGGRKADGGLVPNWDLWKRVRLLHVLTDAKVHWVRGHNGNTGNELADVYAGQQRQIIVKGALESGDQHWLDMSANALLTLEEKRKAQQPTLFTR